MSTCLICRTEGQALPLAEQDAAKIAPGYCVGHEPCLVDFEKFLARLVPAYGEYYAEHTVLAPSSDNGLDAMETEAQRWRYAIADGATHMYGDNPVSFQKQYLIYHQTGKRRLRSKAGAGLLREIEPNKLVKYGYMRPNEVTK